MHFLSAASAALTVGSAYASPLMPRAAAVDQLVGYAAGTTGGGSGSGTTVTTCAALTTAAKTGGVIKISGNLKDCGIVKLVGNTSILGVGSSAGLENSGFQVRKVSNVIIRNIKFHTPPEGKDLVDIDESTKIWVDHCDFSSVGIVGDKDTYDGMLDAKHGSDLLTFSWNKFHDHWKGSLIGHSDNNAAEDTGKLHVTYHHNLFENVSSRLPSIRFGTLHVYSSCYRKNPTSGINVRMGAQALIEASSFTDTAQAIITNLDSDEEGLAIERNNVFSNSPVTITKAGSLSSVPYSYTADAASAACGIVDKSAGVGVVTF
ncbi:polysaccharide lyase family 1 protein [Lentithecium fluviatile CBS 122367]|uniref:Polysaccharide lyase family 1 protein n=1 Tax=Lentithecium fluviatile CBS 122367 TaxID=1168545 RepID=A0A6G1IJK4_9PLEO|nr:polysaccharide lyase family 1 protein [Lentithecium fluviatile CBS 122367]